VRRGLSGRDGFETVGLAVGALLRMRHLLLTTLLNAREINVVNVEMCLPLPLLIHGSGQIGAIFQSLPLDLILRRAGRKSYFFSGIPREDIECEPLTRHVENLLNSSAAW